MTGGVDGGLHRREIILRNVGALLILNKERNSEYGVGWSLKPRLAERLVPKVVAGKKVGGWLEAGRRVVPGGVLSKHCRS